MNDWFRIFPRNVKPRAEAAGKPAWSGGTNRETWERSFGLYISKASIKYRKRSSNSLRSCRSPFPPMTSPGLSLRAPSPACMSPRGSYKSTFCKIPKGSCNCLRKCWHNVCTHHNLHDASNQQDVSFIPGAVQTFFSQQTCVWIQSLSDQSLTSCLCGWGKKTVVQQETLIKMAKR